MFTSCMRCAGQTPKPLATLKRIDDGAEVITRILSGTYEIDEPGDDQNDPNNAWSIKLYGEPGDK